MYEKKITVLDNGFVEYVSHMGSDITVVNAARVSFNKTTKPIFDKDGKETILRLHNYYMQAWQNLKPQLKVLMMHGC